MLKKNIRIFLIILTILMLVFSIYKIANIYAVFYSEISGSASKKLGKWVIEINNTNITQGVTNEFVIDEFHISSNANTLQNVLAPGMELYFDIVIDPNDTDVSIRYDIEFDLSTITNEEINITSIEEIEENNIITRTAENIYTGIIQLSSIDNNYTNEIRVTLDWNNNEANNEQDSILGTVNNTHLQVPTTVTVTQYLGETIQEYE